MSSWWVRTPAASGGLSGRRAAQRELEHRRHEVDPRQAHVGRLDESGVDVDVVRVALDEHGIQRESAVPSKMAPQRLEVLADGGEVDAALVARPATHPFTRPQVRVPRDELAAGEDGLDHGEGTVERCLCQHTSGVEGADRLEVRSRRRRARPSETSRTPRLAVPTGIFTYTGNRSHAARWDASASTVDSG